MKPGGKVNGRTGDYENEHHEWSAVGDDRVQRLGQPKSERSILK